MSKNQEAALLAFISRKSIVEDYLARITLACEDSFGKNPDEINWADVNSVAAVQEKLAEIVNFLNLS